ncbi:MAG: penicillin-binding transpeptidase domain-containing protein [Nitriliruptoraceae bacterium]
MPTVRIRDVFLALVGVAVLVLALAAGWNWLSGFFQRADASADPVTTVAAYLEAWQAGDHLAMVDHVRNPTDDFVARHDQLIVGLDVQSLELLAQAPQQQVEGRVVVPVEVRAHVDYNPEPIVWPVELTVIREHGEWGIDWSLRAIHPELRDAWQFATESEPVGRAPILAADGTQLAGDTTIVSFGFEPSAVKDPEAMVAAFESAIPGSGRIAEREISRSNLVDGWFYPVATQHEARAGPSWDRLRGVAGVLRQSTTTRGLYDDGFAQHVVGIVAEATAEQLAELGDSAQPGMRIPQFGLERVMDDRLTGSDVVRAGLREGADGPVRRLLSESQADPSGPVRTTINVRVQQAVEVAVRDASARVGFVVVDANDGAIVAAASRPLNEYNRAFAGRYPPGSTFKIVTLEALLADGATLDDHVSCPAETIVGGLRVPNAQGFELGTVTIREAFAASCNTTFATLGARVGGDALEAAAQRFGFGVEPLVPLTAFGGSFPPPQDTAETAAAAFGQGRVEASALQMAAVAAAAVHGTWRQPFIVAADGPGRTVPLSRSVAEPLTDAMRAAVTDGTGTQAQVDGVDVVGKTGTAQVAGGAEHAWFVGAVDHYGFAIIVEDGGAGGDVAAPIARRFAEFLRG